MRLFLAIVLILTVQVAARPPKSAPAWGPTADGLRVGVRFVAGRVEATLHNAGKKDVVLNLGVMLANGARHYPSALRITAVDARGQERTLVLEPAFVAGRLDPLIMPLSAGARYTVPLDLGTAVVQGKGDRLAAGKYRIQVGYQGKRVPKTAVPDMPGLALMNYWEGRVQSAVIEYVHAAR